jgi:hypothetical protein
MESKEASSERKYTLEEVKSYLAIYEEITRRFSETRTSTYIAPGGREAIRKLVKNAKIILPQEFQDERFKKYISGLEEKAHQ